MDISDKNAVGSSVADPGAPDPGIAALRAAALGAAAHYRAATGIRCVAVAPDGRPLGTAEVEGCGVCAAIRAGGGEEQCAGIHRYGTYQSERFGGVYIYFCPRNLTHWAAPIRVSGVTLASLIGGPVLIVEPDDFEYQELRLPGFASDEAVRALDEAVESLQYIDPRRVSSLAETLKLCAQAVSAQVGAALPHVLTEPVEPIRPSPLRRTGEGGGKRLKYPISKERDLISAIETGNLDSARRELNDILGFIYFYSNHDLDVVKLRVLELVVLLSRAAINGGAAIEEIIGLNNDYLVRLQNSRSEYELSAALAAILTRFVDCVFTLKTIKRADLIQKSLRYIHQGYAQEITLDDAAFHVDLSAAHFSRLFKEAVGETFIGYLTTVRIKSAERLLADRSIPLSQIGARVGFEDQSYFSKVFKGRTGLSPGKFRERRGIRALVQGQDESDIEIHE